MNLANEVQGVTEVPYYLHKQTRQDRKDQPWRRLATLNKIAQKPGYNLPNYQEKRTIAELLNQYGEYAYLTGKKLGTYYLSTLDLDWKKEEFPKKLIKKLEKNAICLLNFLKVSWDKSKKGGHIDILTLEPLENGIIYRIDKLGKKWTIGSIQSRGKYVVGEDPDKHFIKNGKWYWKTQDNQEVKATLNKFFFIFKEVQKPTEIAEINPFLLNPPKPLRPLGQPKNYFVIQAKILSKHKTNLENILKVFYLNNQEGKNYFLLNHYQRKHFNLNIGVTQNILLINGQKHRFFYRSLNP